MRKTLANALKKRTYLGRATLFVGFIVSMEIIGKMLSGHNMPLPSLCGFIVFGPLAFLCGALLYEITTYLVRRAFFLFGVAILLGELSKCVFRNGCVTNL